MKRQIRKNLEDLKNNEVEESPLGFLINNVAKNYNAFLNDYLNKINLSHSQIYLLLALEYKDNVTQEFLASKLNISEGTVTKLIKSLEKVDLIERKQNKSDKRKKSLKITDKGKEIVKEFHVVISEFNAELMEDFTEEEFFILRILLKKMSITLDKKYSTRGD